MWWSKLTGRLERASALDPVTDTVERGVHAVLPRGPAKDALHGVWLGHAVHPLLVTVPIGLWTGALLLDLTGDPGRRRAAQTLVGAGVLAVAPTAATGLADWSELGLFRRPKRVGLVHALANGLTAGLYAASWLARRRGDQARGTGLALVGAGTMAVGGYLGGHLSYSEGVGVNRNADVSPEPADWTDVAAEADVQAPGLHRVEVGGEPVLLNLHAGRWRAIHARCSHYGAPLDTGTVDGDCVICPWHGSAFSLEHGGVERGPATSPQLSYDVRVTGGRVQLRVRR
ncbi:MAG: Rieske (2Fe-2S) protein [Frankiales bacterium]|nr:Rieske (2Fe-2S) protein [Frankiales bacterium]